MNTNNPHHESLLSSRSLLATVRLASSLQCQGIIPCWQSPTASSQQCYSHCELPLKPDLHSKVEGRTQLARLPQIPFRLHIGMPGNSLHSFSCPHPHSFELSCPCRPNLHLRRFPIGHGSASLPWLCQFAFERERVSTAATELNRPL